MIKHIVWSIGLLVAAGFVCKADVKSAGIAPIHDRQRTIINLDGEWQTAPIHGINFTYPPSSDIKWSDVKIPELPGTTIKEGNPYCPSTAELLTKDGNSFLKNEGIACWYKKRFHAPSAPDECGRIVLQINGATYRSDIWLNGSKLGHSLNGLLPCEYDITSIIKPDAENELLIGLTGRQGLLNVANKTFLSPSSGVGAGLWGQVEILYLPKSFIKNVFIKTSVKDKKIVLETSIINTEKKAREYKLSAIIYDSQTGRILTSIAPTSLNVPADGNITLELSKNWIAPELWSPENPALLWAELTLSDNHNTMDTKKIRFGFREFEIRGRDFYLNGVRTVLLRNSWLKTIPTPRFQVFDNAKSTSTHPYNCFRLHIGFNCDAAIKACDELGILTIPESSWHNFNNKFPMDKVDIWLPEVVSYTEALIKRYRNNPSVIMWNLTNESLWGNTDEPRMKIADALIAAAEGTDNTRPCAGDGEVNWGGRLPIINIHYPESSIENSLREKYPNSGTVFPNDCHWLRKDGINTSWRASFKWDRPLIIGEYWFPSGDPDRMTSFMGESVYDWRQWSFQSMAGREGRTDGEFYKSTQMITDAYRMDGVAGINPWACENENLMLPVNVRPVDFFPNLFAGKVSVRKFVVFNDTQKSMPGAQLQCRLTSGGRVVWEKIIGAHVDPGSFNIFDVPIECPMAKTIRPARLSVRLRENSGGWRQRALYEERVFIVPETSLAALSHFSIGVLDSNGKTLAALKTMGYSPKQIQTVTDAALSKLKVLVIGEDTDASPYRDVIASFVKSGGVAIVLRQDKVTSLGNGLPEIDPAHITTRSWKRDYNHPILEGIEDGQLSYWRSNHIVAKKSYEKPGNGPARTLIDAGGLYGLRWSSLLEFPMGKGCYLLSQLCLTDKIGVEPMAGLLLKRILNYAADYDILKPLSMPLRILTGDNSDTVKIIAEAGVETSNGLNGEGPVFLDASYNISTQEMTVLKDYLEKGGMVWLHGFSSQNIDKLAPLLPFKLEMTPADPKIHIAARRSSDPLMNNLSSFDFCWTRMDAGFRWNFFEASSPTAKLGTELLQLSALDVGTPLLDPGFMVKIPVGKGTILFDSLAWDKAFGAESERVLRIVAGLAGNMGARVRIIKDDTPFDYFHVDFNTVANMGFYDRTADDGVGGWTDQGQNDMRFFLINHTGRGGGLDNGMEVEAECFPETVKFLDRPFKIPDPRKNNDKSIISLRGEMHGAKLPEKAEGIKVGKKADRLWMLHAAGWAPPKSGMEVAKYVINYEDGSKTVVPIRFNMEVSDWWNPQPLTNAKVAWTGRNLAHSPIGFYIMEWRNPSPEKEIATIDIIGNVAPTQFVCLGITGGVESGNTISSGCAAFWKMNEVVNGMVKNQVTDGGDLKIGTPAPVPAVIENIKGLKFKDGANLTADDKTCADLFNAPFAVKVKLCVEAPPPGYMGGIFQRMQYGKAGFRLAVYRDLKIGAEIFSGGKHLGIHSSFPLQSGKWYDVELRFDGKYAFLLLDGKVSGTLETDLPAQCMAAISIGKASGKDYFLNGIIESIELRKVSKSK